MPAPTLPVTWRPVVTRRTVTAMACLLLATTGALAVLLPEGSGGAGDRLAFVGFGLAGAGCLALFARPRVTADDAGVTVVNLVRRRRLAWTQIVAVELRPGAPWAALDLDDGETLPAMGIQSSDGDRARRAAADLALLVTVRSPTARDD